MKIRAILGNRFVTLIEPYPKSQLDSFFSFYVPGYLFTSMYRSGKWDGRIKKLVKGRVPTGLFLALRDDAKEKLGIEFDVKENLLPVEFKEGIFSDREFQNRCLEAMKSAAQYGGGLIKSGTGTGKTLMAGMFFKSLVGPGCFVVDELALMRQSQEALSKYLEEPVGIIGGGQFDIFERISVATVQTLYARRERSEFKRWAPTLQAMLIDEFHVAMNKRNISVVEAIRPPALFGLTATIQMTKKEVRMGAYSLAGPLIFEFPLEEATDQGYLAKGAVFQLGVPAQYIDFGEYISDYTLGIVQNKQRNKIISEIAAHALKRKRAVVILVQRLDHLKILGKMLKKFSPAILKGSVKAKERNDTVKKFDKGKVSLLIGNKVFYKGIDIKRLDFIIDATASSDRNGCVQRYGRGVRPFEGKRSLVYIDIDDIGNRFQHAGRVRLRAFKKEGIEVFKILWKDSIDLGKLVDKSITIAERKT